MSAAAPKKLAPTSSQLAEAVPCPVPKPTETIEEKTMLLQNEALTLSRMGLDRFVRLKREPNKEAMLAEPDAVRGIAGVSIVTGVEDFIVTPFEVEVTQ